MNSNTDDPSIGLYLPDEKYQELTPWQKLQAMAARYYLRDRNPWQPKVGDYYTSCRADLELYRIVKEDDDNFYTVYCDKRSFPVPWLKSGFLTEGFGPNRLQVPLYILETKQ